MIGIPREQGFLSFWRGNGINIFRIIPNTTIRFSSYDTIKKFVAPKGELGYTVRID